LAHYQDDYRPFLTVSGGQESEEEDRGEFEVGVCASSNASATQLLTACEFRKNTFFTN
jgi:hypothetical protein